MKSNSTEVEFNKNHIVSVSKTYALGIPNGEYYFVNEDADSFSGCTLINIDDVYKQWIRTMPADYKLNVHPYTEAELNGLIKKEFINDELVFGYKPYYGIHIGGIYMNKDGCGTIIVKGYSTQCNSFNIYPNRYMDRKDINKHYEYIGKCTNLKYLK